MNRPTRNALLLFSGEAVSRLFGFLSATILARRLGVDGFGQVGFASAVFMYGVILTDFGLLTVGTRSVASNPETASELVGRLVPLRLVLGLAAAAFIAVLAIVLPRPVEVRLLLVVYASGTAVQALLLEWFFFGVEQMGAVSSARILTHLSYYGLVLLLVRGPQGILMVPLAFIGSTLLAVLLLLALYRRRFGDIQLRLALGGWGGLVRQAWPVGAAGVFTQLHVNFGLVGLGLFRTDAETGLYSSAYRLVFFLLALDRVFYTVFFPVASRIQASRPERLPELTGTVLRLILVVSLPLGTGLVVLARPILAAVFGPDYIEAAPALQTMAVFLPVSMLSSMTGHTLIAAGRERRFLRNVLFGTLVSIAAGLVGIALLGVRGAAMAVVAGETAILVPMFVDFLRLVHPRMDRRLAAAPVASAALVPVCLLLGRFGLAVPILVGAGVYAVLLFALGGVTLRELGMVRAG